MHVNHRRGTDHRDIRITSGQRHSRKARAAFHAKRAALRSAGDYTAKGVQA